MIFICKICHGYPCELNDNMDKYKLTNPEICPFYDIKPKWKLKK